MASGPLAQGCQVCPSAKHIQQALGAWGCPCTQPHVILTWKTMLVQVRKKSRRRVVLWGSCGFELGFFCLFYCFTSPCHLSVSWGWSGGFMVFFFPRHNAVENYSAFSYFLINFWRRYLAHVLDSRFNDKSTFKHNRQISAIEDLFWCLLLVSAT